MVIKALQYPDIRIGLARNELTTLKKTTVVSLFEVLSDWGLKVGKHYNYNSTSGIIKFFNGSEIVLLELAYKPSDPDYTRLGGHLLTFGVIDEVGEVDVAGHNIFKTRLGRWNNEEYGIKPICIMTCNPTKNWLYRDWYKPFIEGSLKPYQMFIPALPTDNPYLPQAYIENLTKLPLADRERLLDGNWDYDNDPTCLLTYDEILNVWDGIPDKNRSLSANKKYITADIAFTSDKMVIILWDDLCIEEIYVNPKGNIEEVIMDIAKANNVPQYNIAYDSDGVGKFLDTRLRNAKPIVNNAQALKGENYKNLKTQLYFKLCDMIEDNRVKCRPDSNKEEIMEELAVVRHKPTAKAGKIEMIDKAQMKRLLGRSPDFADAMAYRMLFEYNTNAGVKPFRIG